MSVEGFQETETLVAVEEVLAKPVGVVGGVLSAGELGVVPVL